MNSMRIKRTAIGLLFLLFCGVDANSSGLSFREKLQFQNKFEDFISSDTLVGGRGIPVRVICLDPDTTCFKLSGVIDKFYALSKNRALWPQHARSVLEWGGHIATVKSLQHNEAFRQKASRAGLGVPWVWIGYNDAVESGRWVWHAGGSNDYVNWFSGEPNNKCNCREGKEEYAALHTGTGRWNDYASHNEYSYRFPAIYEFSLR